jgi:hypothetical protein
MFEKRQSKTNQIPRGNQTMKNVFAVLIVLVICVIGFGFYRGWFAVSSPSSSEGNNEVNINLATDTDKMKQDAESVQDKAAELSGNSPEEDSAEPDDQPTDEDELSPKQAPTDDEQSPVETPDGAPLNNK